MSNPEVLFVLIRLLRHRWEQCVSSTSPAHGLILPILVSIDHRARQGPAGKGMQGKAGMEMNRRKAHRVTQRFEKRAMNRLGASHGSVVRGKQREPALIITELPATIQQTWNENLGFWFLFLGSDGTQADNPSASIQPR